MNVVVNNLMTSYRLAGKGKLVLMLHGWGDNQQSFRSITEQLSKSYQVLTLDLPGFGGTQASETVWDLDNYADFVEATITKLDLSAPYAVVGHSNGGALAIRAIGAGKLEPEKLVLIAASGIRTGNQLKRLALKIVAKVGNIATIWMPERYRQALRKSLYGVAGSDMLVAPHLKETFKRTVRQDVQADAAKIQLPTLLIYGKQDEAVPLADGRKYNELIKDSKLEILPGGHFVHQEDSEKTYNLIEGFLK